MTSLHTRVREEDVNALVDVVKRHKPDLVDVAKAITSRALTRDEREALREAVASELCSEGLDENDEPNQYGLRLERLIDKLGE